MKRHTILLLLTLAGCARSDANLAASGTVEATEAQLGFQTPGRIDTIRVHEGDRVHRGDTLAVLDRSELLARRAQADAQAQSARALLSELEAGSRSEDRVSAQQALRAVNDRLADAQREFDRSRRLHDAGAVSQEQFEKSRLAIDVLQSQKSQAEPAEETQKATSLFTSRQLAVIEALRKGKANKIIAYELNMRESTVKVHVRNIMKKLKARNRTEVAYLANSMLSGDSN